MYQQISKQRTTRELYAEALIQAGRIDAERAQAKIDEYRNALDNGLHVVKSLVKEPNRELFVDWRPYLGHAWTARHDTRFDLKTLQDLSGQAAGTARRLRRSASGLEDLRRSPEDAGRWLADQLGLCRDHGLRHPGSSKVTRSA